MDAGAQELAFAFRPDPWVGTDSLSLECISLDFDWCHHSRGQWH